MTLREGLEEYYTGHPGLLQPDKMHADAARFFHAHDTCHVLFGLDTTLVDESLADLWTLFGTDVGFRGMPTIFELTPPPSRLRRRLDFFE